MKFRFLRKKRKYMDDDWEEELACRDKYAPLITQEDPEVARKKAIASAKNRKDMAIVRCEELFDAIKVLDDLKREYRDVTALLSDVEKIEHMDRSRLDPICDTARQIAKLDLARNAFLNKEHTLSDRKYAQFQEEEPQMPGIIRRFQDNERYLEALKKDLRLLDGEKIQCEMVREDNLDEQQNLKKLSVAVLILAFVAVFLLVLMYFLLEMDTMLYMLLVTFLAVAYAAYALFKHQDLNREIAQSNVNRNKAIDLQNHVKIKYVTIQNAVDYVCNKYEVKSSAELIYNWEQFQEMIREKQRMRETSDDLVYYSNRMVELLENEHFHDARNWLQYNSALMERKEMVELKHENLEKRKQIRKQIDHQVGAIRLLREEIEGYVYEAGGELQEIAKLLRQIDALNISGVS